MRIRYKNSIDIKKIMTKLKLNPNFTYYFGIYVVKKDTDNSIQSNFFYIN